LHHLLQEIVDEAIKEFDFTILDAQRGRAEQERAFHEHKSNAHFGQSAHNYVPAVAMDLAPYPIDFNDIKRFQALHSIIMPIAARLKIPLDWGGDWKTLKDMPHFELSPWRQWAKESRLIDD
jgi:peptidoglycan L-alanyl-D-glutamate endopeptidase CwlK